MKNTIPLRRRMLLVLCVLFSLIPVPLRAAVPSFQDVTNIVTGILAAVPPGGIPAYATNSNYATNAGYAGVATNAQAGWPTQWPVAAITNLPSYQPLNSLLTTISTDGYVPTAALATNTPAANLTGSTLAAGVTASSLTSVGTLTGLTVNGNAQITQTNFVGELVVTNGITLGGVWQTTWPSGGSGGGTPYIAIDTSGGNVIHNLATNAIILKTNILNALLLVGNGATSYVYGLAEVRIYPFISTSPPYTNYTITQ